MDRTEEVVSPHAALKERWQTLRDSEPRMRIRDAADRLGVSEAELLATGMNGELVRLEPRFDVLLPRLESLGRVMALTRNASAVHEKKGVYRKVELHGARALVLDEDIDLRLFLSRWCFVFALREDLHGQVRRSFQVFDAAGTAVHKIYLQDDANVAAFEGLVRELQHEDQGHVLDVVPVSPPAEPRPDSEIDALGLKAGWRALQDTHEFFALLNKFKVARTQALRLAGTEFAKPVVPDALGWTLERAAATQLPIMVFVGNPGAIQIHTGPVRTVRPMGPWMNVMDPGFNLHVRADQVHSAWVVRKPTRDGDVTSLELFDKAGENIALLFGKRKPGELESPAWRTLMEELVRTLPAVEVAS
ncbi:hemin-degrading factor [Corallococcus carmarthensis]|uniref:Hemin-degrading factor n=1 Tax=Corallococcus carmarthensis TaxID=2316728 RepID=A0A3A8JSH0_9BACT|nr:ChuX/HutX family heme-like substrate-binding protein [Corallococcus carmarthensis]NOK20061.1 hemin-degrading factor [Corallococcus carmarthensis]RKG97926.1 hemin-degrading factor [Corallococcus carmarthensis]